MKIFSLLFPMFPSLSSIIFPLIKNYLLWFKDYEIFGESRVTWCCLKFPSIPRRKSVKTFWRASLLLRLCEIFWWQPSFSHLNLQNSTSHRRIVSKNQRFELFTDFLSISQIRGWVEGANVNRRQSGFSSRFLQTLLWTGFCCLSDTAKISLAFHSQVYFLVFKNWGFWISWRTEQ